MTKSEIRTSLNIMKRYIKVTKCAQEIGIHSSAISRFMKYEYYNCAISEDKLNELYHYIVACVENVT